MRTEEQAKKMICPQMGQLVIEDGNITHGAGCCCIASECMMWRLVGGRSGSGYCGLAGKP
jgi:hypothetical protein